MELAYSQPFANFRAWVPRNRLPIGHTNPNQWVYYDWGPRSYPEPIICLHSLIGSAESFFYQLIALAPLGYRVITVNIPVYWSVPEFCDALHIFLETLSIRRAHFYGAGLGGFLALHYTARRPERVVSLMLTHSFLSTANLNLPVPYSISVLKWLPSFLVHSTMRAILPKGRTTVQLANAAEFAIGHTLRCNRDTLASRLALSLSTTSVIDRILVPGQRITLIDTLDRSPAALQLSDDTASQLPRARRALLKRGSDFPYLSVPEDVNVHLVVHMRRNAPKPEGPIPVPPPAKPRPLPPSIVRRRRKKREMGNRTSVSQEEIERRAHSAVQQDEALNVQRFRQQIVHLKDYLPERDDAFLAAVMSHCEGDLDLALINVRNNIYDDMFYDHYKKEAFKCACETIREEENQKHSRETQGQEESGDVSIHETGETVTERNASGDVEGQKEYDNESVSASSSTERHPLGSRQTSVSKTIVSEVYISDESEELPQQTSTEEHDAIPIPAMNARDADANSNSPEKDGEPMQTRLSSMETIIHQEVDDGYTSSSTGRDSPVEGDSRKLSRSSSRTHRRVRGRAYSEDGEALSDYVSSEKVGMRSTGTFVGRGPAPLRNYSESLVTSDWMRAPLPPREEDEEVDIDGDEDKGKGVGSLEPASGASLLEADEDPLELPTHTSPRSPGDRRRGIYRSRSKSSDRQYTQGHSSTRDPKSFSWKSMFPKESEVDAPATEKQTDRSEDMQSPSRGAVFGKSAGDEWQSYRSGEDPLVSPAQVDPLEEKGVESEGEKTKDLEKGSDEQERLRAWRMSAQEASSSVRR
ncbi:Maspardin [Gracilaria domingensis]|nr:Maspardin [Gracilaria domingensis]